MAIPRRTYAEEIYGQLRDEILSGHLRPGDRLAEVEIAQRMGTSQGPVREAFARLREQGLLISFRHQGSYVSEISEEEARHAYALRGTIEPLALKWALPRMGDAEFAILENQIREIEAAAKAGDLAAIVASDMRFHRYLYEWAGSTTLLHCWDVIESNIRKFAIVASPPVFKDLMGPARSHRTLLEHMQSGYSPGLERELDRHLKSIWTDKPPEPPETNGTIQ
jgi:DNA-binding GntR family transcriptional regulator